MRAASVPNRTHHRRSGFIYVVALGTTLIVTIIGISVITVIRIQGRSHGGERDLAEAGILAFSGVEHALHKLGTTPDWRTQFENDVTVAEHPLGRGTLSWWLHDDDGNLADDPDDPVAVIATGTVNNATYRTRVELEFGSTDGCPHVKPAGKERYGGE